MTTEEIIALLAGVRRAGDGWDARCPVPEHDDHRQSLHVCEGRDGRTLLTCYRGCPVEEITAAIGLTMQDLFPANGDRAPHAPSASRSGDRSGDRGPVVATYHYVDEAGKELFRKLRYANKDFRQCRVVDGKTIWSLGDTRRVLYHLPAVLAAARRGDAIFIVEGEKDVAAVEQAGGVATCNPEGASASPDKPKWKEAYTKMLKGAGAVIVVADRDETGRIHARQEVDSLKRAGIPGKLVEAAAGKDAFDHLTSGLTLDDFTLIEEFGRKDSVETGFAYIDWQQFWAADHADEEWLFQDVIALGRAHVIYAKHGVGKSLFTAYMCAKMAVEGRAIVQYLDFEMTQADLFERLSDMGYGPGTDLSRLHYALLPSLPPLDTDAGGELLLESVDALRKKYPDLPLVTVVDTMSRAVLGEDDKADTIRAFYRHCGLGLKQRGVTWVRLDHEGKDKVKGQRGTSAKGDDVDVVWQLERTQSGMRLHRKKARMGWVSELVQFGEFYGPLRFIPVVNDWPAGTASLANLLDRLEVPIDASRRTAELKLREVNEGRRHELIVAALRWRCERNEESGTSAGTTPGPRDHSDSLFPGPVRDHAGQVPN